MLPPLGTSYRKVTLPFPQINLATTELIWPLGRMVSGMSRNSLWHIKSLAVTFILGQVASVSVGSSRGLREIEPDDRWSQPGEADW